MQGDVKKIIMHLCTYCMYYFIETMKNLESFHKPVHCRAIII